MARSPELDARLLAESGWVRALARELAGDAHAADDLEQEAWLAALERAPDARGPLSPWFTRVLRNLAAKGRRGALRRGERERRAARAEAEPSSADVVLVAARQRELVGAVLALEEPYRTTVLQRYLEELPPRAIAHRQGVPVRTVQTRLARGLALLRAELGARRDAPEEWLAGLVAFRPRGTPLTLLPWIAMKPKAWIAALALLVIGLGARRWWPAGGEPAPSAAPAVVAPALATRPVPASEPALEPAPGREVQPGSAGAPPIDPERDLRGIVVATDGEPIAGAALTVLLAADRQAPDGLAPEAEPARATARTEEDGRFRFRLEPAETYDLDVEASGRAHLRRPSLYAGEELRIVLPRAAAIVGRVREAGSGAPLAGVEVVASAGIVQSPGALRPRARSAADGSYRLDALAADVFQVGAAVAGHVHGSRSALRVGEGEELCVDFELERGIGLHGRVTDGTTHAPIAGARVELASQPGGALTDADGRYELRGLTADANLVRVQAEGYGRFDLELGDLGPQDREQDFFLLRGRRARGRLVDRSGAPVVHASISAWADRPGDAERPNDLGHARSDEDGRFELADLRADLRHSLFVRAAGHASALFDFPAAELDGAVLELGELVLERPGTIAGRLLDREHRPLPDLWVLLTAEPARRDALGPIDGGEGYAAGEGFGLGRIHAHTDARGRYALTDLPAGRYWLSGGSKGFARRAELEIELAEGEELDDVDLYLDWGLTLEGVVVDAEGTLLPGASVRIWSRAAEPGGFRSSLTYDLARADGRFRLVGLEPGDYDVTATAGFSGRSDPPGFETRLAGVVAGTTDLRITLARPAPIAGVVRDDAGRPVADAHVCMPRFGEEQISEGRTDEAGRFRIWAAAGAPTTLSIVRAEDFGAGLDRWTKLENVLPGTDDLEITLAR